MQIKELVREKVLTEIIAERDEVILNQHQHISMVEKERDGLRAEVEAMGKEISRLREASDGTI